jgi:hypothetical protein
MNPTFYVVEQSVRTSGAPCPACGGDPAWGCFSGCTGRSWYWYEVDRAGGALDVDQYVGPFATYQEAFRAAGSDTLPLGRPL